MNDAGVSRMNLWLVAALVVAIALLAVVTFLTLQPIVAHWIGAALQGPTHIAGRCPPASGPCP